MLQTKVCAVNMYVLTLTAWFHIWACKYYNKTQKNYINFFLLLNTNTWETEVGIGYFILLLAINKLWTVLRFQVFYDSQAHGMESYLKSYKFLS
jgi:hypothetical protein